MKIAVMGAGAVGCYYGAMLALAGHQVVLIGRPALVRAVQADGLVLEKDGQRHVCDVMATDDPAAVTGADMVLFCVKSGDTETAGQQIAPHLGAGALLLSLQNGVSNAERLAQVTGHSVIPTVVYVASAMAGPGVVCHEGRGDLAIGGPGADAAGAVLRAAGVETDVSDQVMTALWAKLVLNCAYNAVSAIARLPYGVLAQVDGVMPLLDQIVAECRTVAAAEGITLPEEVSQTVHGIPNWMPGQFSSTAQDVMRGRPSEIDFLNGEIVRLAAKHGIDVPINRTLTLLVKLIERQQAE